jgi:hypothetical protein
MLQWTFCCVWSWDARPFPAFPALASVWGDAANWAYGDWQGAGRTPTPPLNGSADPSPSQFPSFPTLSLGWSAQARPRFETGVAPHASGRESRRARRATALYDVELVYDLLRADANAEFSAIAGFYLASAGQGGAFWLAPPGLALATGEKLGVGDGLTTAFPLRRSFAGYSEPVQATSGVSAVYLDGAAQSSGWSVSSGFQPAVTFTVPPPAGANVSADFGALWLCRFAEDVADLENFMTLLWSWGGVKLQTVRP